MQKGSIGVKKISKLITVIMAAAILVMSLAGCTTGKNGSAEEKDGAGQENNQLKVQDKAGEEKILTAADGQSSIKLFEGWEEVPDLHEDAELQAAYIRREMYFIALEENKQAFSKDMDLNTYLGLVKNNYKETVKNAEISEEKELTIDGHPSKQFIVRGEVENLKAAYLVTVVNGERSYYQLVTWTLDYMFKDNRYELEQVISSFKELDDEEKEKAGEAGDDNGKDNAETKK